MLSTMAKSGSGIPLLDARRYPLNRGKTITTNV